MLVCVNRVNSIFVIPDLVLVLVGSIICRGSSSKPVTVTVSTSKCLVVKYSKVKCKKPDLSKGRSRNYKNKQFEELKTLPFPVY